MLHLLFKAIAFYLLITLVGCCLAVACDYIPTSVTLRIMRNGKNALYGPDAFLTKSDLKHIIIVGQNTEEENIEFDDSLQTITLYVSMQSPAILEIKNVSSDTISITSEIDRQGCCDSPQITSVLRNGEVICEGLCAEIIELEI